VDAVLELRDVSKSYPTAGGGSREVLRGVDLALHSGRASALVGRSGSGKSTLLHLAAGIEPPTSGEVRLLGRDLARLGDAERTRARRDAVGLVFQFFHLLPHLPVLDNVLVPALVAGDSPRSSSARARELLERIGLGGRERDPVQKLSGGEMQRVAICRALLRKPRLLLADEPTGNLDEESGERVMGLLLRLAREEGSALLYATHSGEVAAAADETWSVHSGAVERIGRAAERA
jgi:ABC-type lipoprotein export system ATPase subunit